MLTYGHGDVVLGYDAQWRAGLSPWTLTSEGDRWYGRGTADNKGQHTINLAALARVLEARGRLGFNVKVLLETGEETGSPGLRDVCEREREALAADVLIASDGPRLRAEQPTLFLGSRGAFNFDLTVDLRAGGHHSGNWGGLLANPGIDPRARHRFAGRCARAHPGRGAAAAADSAHRVRAALADIVPGEPGGPRSTPHWGEPGLTPAERVFAWNTLEVLAFVTGNPAASRSTRFRRARPRTCSCASSSAAIRTRSCRRCARTSTRTALPTSTSAPARAAMMHATRLDPTHPWVHARRDVDRGDDRSRARDPAQPRRLAAQRLLRRRARACRRCGCRTRIRLARSTRRRAPARARSRAKGLRS